MRILLAKRRALGDTVLMTSTVESLAREPGMEISVLVPESFRAVFEGNPHVKKLFTFEEGIFSLVPKIRALHLDYFFRLHAGQRQEILPWLSGAKRVMAHRQNSGTEKAYGKHPNALEWDLFFLREALGKDFSEATPKIYLSEEEKRVGELFWESHGVHGKEVIFLGLGASRATKRWPARHFARFAELLRDRLGLTVAIVTGPGDEEETFSGQVVNELRVLGMRPRVGKSKGDFLHFAGFDVRKLAGLLSAVKCYVGNDSGPKHLALALGVPTFTFFGPEDPVEWHPYSRERHPVLFQASLACRREDNGRWCAIAECVAERHRCMEDLRPDEAFTKVEEFFRVS